jgi:Neuraminidase (sialidase)
MISRCCRVWWGASIATSVLLAACVSSTPSVGLSPTELNVTNDVTHRFGEPEIAVNPTNPNNLLYFIMSNKLTFACEAGGDPNCTTVVNGSPAGQYNVPGWISTRLFVSFDRGRTWTQKDFPSIPRFRGFPGEAADHSDLLSMGDPMVTATADGTFHIGWDSMHLGYQNVPGYGEHMGSLLDGGIAVSKSTDGGRTWSTPVLTGTGVDRPWMAADLSTGTIYEASSGSINGSMATGNPALPIMASATDRWVVSSPDGVHWTTPVGLGGGGFSGASGSNITAAHGVLAATFMGTTAEACKYFVSAPAPCAVFETSMDSGAHWTRHPVTGLSGAKGSLQVAADPTCPGTYTVVAPNSQQTQLVIYVTHDAGVTWSGPATLTDDANTTKFKAWINYSPKGVFGAMWRSVLPGAVAPTARAPVPYTVWAATSNDNGATFSQPLQISSASSPAPDAKLPGGSDDTSAITLSDQDAFVGWADWRPGNMAGYFRAVKLGAFKHPPGHQRRSHDQCHR